MQHPKYVDLHLGTKYHSTLWANHFLYSWIGLLLPNNDIILGKPFFYFCEAKLLDQFNSDNKHILFPYWIVMKIRDILFKLSGNRGYSRHGSFYLYDFSHIMAVLIPSTSSSGLPFSNLTSTMLPQWSIWNENVFDSFLCNQLLGGCSFDASTACENPSSNPYCFLLL